MMKSDFMEQKFFYKEKYFFVKRILVDDKN